MLGLDVACHTIVRPYGGGDNSWEPKPLYIESALKLGQAVHSLRSHMRPALTKPIQKSKDNRPAKSP